MSIARRFATAAVYGGGGMGVLGASTVFFLAVEGALARRTVGPPSSEPPDVNGRYAAPGVVDHDALTLVIVGDSSAAGLGAYEPAETPGGRLALGLSEASGRAVRVHGVAKVGAQSCDLAEQVSAALTEVPGPDIAVIIIGANDVTHLRQPIACARELGDAIARLRAAGAAVVVGTCPDLGMIQVISQPLRTLCRARCRQLATLQAVACVEKGARAVSLGDLLGPAFAQRPHELFSQDRFHPSAAGYAAAAEAMLPSVVGAVGVEPAGEEEARPVGTLPVRLAAAEASR
ncbi:MAG: SGNH/GDSL hydrolase family protein, partial [Streptosporangiales bacterium]|nr:SGNH/GDSL hydrolase family protein [Streptosporangiales bacterium]